MHSAVIPAPAMAGVLGMTRQRRDSGSKAVRRSRLHPAAMEATALPASAPASGRTAPSSTWGLTARTTMSAHAQSASPLEKPRAPSSCSARRTAASLMS